MIKNEKVLRPYLHFSSILFQIPVYHLGVSFCFSVRFWQPFSRAILNFMVKTVLKHKKYPSIRFLTSELARNDTSFVSMTHLILNITAYVFFFQYGVGAYFWAAILDFKVTMVRNIVKSFYYISITFMMPELTGNYTSFAFLSSL